MIGEGCTEKRRFFELVELWIWWVDEEDLLDSAKSELPTKGPATPNPSDQYPATVGHSRSTCSVRYRSRIWQILGQSFASHLLSESSPRQAYYLQLLPPFVCLPVPCSPSTEESGHIERLFHYFLDSYWETLCWEPCGESWGC